jgi:hypothetical protein
VDSNFTPTSTALVSPESTCAGDPVKSRIVSSGVTADDAAYAPVPELLLAVTWNVYAVPLVNPVTVADVADAPAVTGVPAVDPAYGVTVYDVGVPPLTGADQLTSA